MARLSINQNPDYERVSVLKDIPTIVSDSCAPIQISSVEIKEIEVEKIVYVDRPIEVEKVIYVDKPFEVIKEVQIEKVIKEQVEVPVYVPQPVEVIKEKEILKVTNKIPNWVWYLLSIETLSLVLLILNK